MKIIIHKMRRIVVKITCLCILLASFPGSIHAEMSSTSSGGLNPVVIAGGTFGDIDPVFLTDDGKVWGAKKSANLSNKMIFDKVLLNNVSVLETSMYMNAAVKNDGTVWVWGGSPDYGDGKGSRPESAVPVQIPGLNGAIDVSVGYTGSVFVLKKDGTLWAWGENTYGQLGDGTTINRTFPVQVKGISSVTDVAAANNYTVALKNDGTVWAWGYNRNGQLGDGTSVNKLSPVRVLNISSITEIYAFDDGAFATKNHGDAWAWGANWNGSLGDGTTITRNTPVKIDYPGPVNKIISSDAYMYGLSGDGTVLKWGDGIKSPVQIPQFTTYYDMKDIYFNDLDILIAKNSNGEYFYYEGNYLRPFYFQSYTLFATPVLSLDNVSPTSATLKWTASNLNGISGYNIYGDGYLIATTQGNTYTINNSAQEIITFEVRAKDGQGNISLGSNIINKALLNIYVYDINGRLDYILLPNKKIIDYQYDANGNLIKKILSN